MTPRFSLRTRFVVAALACLLPLLGVVLYVLYQSLAHSEQQLQDTQLAVADVVAKGLQATIEENTAVLDRLAMDPVVLNMNVEGGAQKLFTQFEQARPSLYGLFLVDVFGAIRAQTGVDPAPLRLDFQPALDRALLGETGVSKRLSEPADGGSIAILVPVQDADEGQPIGAIGALLSLESIRRAFLPFAQTQTTIAVVADKQIIASSPESDPTGGDLSVRLAAPIEAVAAGAGGTLTYKDETGAEHLAVSEPVPNADWAVLVTNPSITTYGPNRLLLERGVAALVVAVLATLVLATILGERTARPLRRLTEHATALAQGDFDHELGPLGKGELGTLGVAVREMADRLATQVRDVEAAREERELQAEQLRDLNRRTVRLQEDERRRIASEIHDAVSPLITGALYQARALRLSNGLGDRQEDGLAAVGELLERATEELHGVIFALRPPDLDDIGVVAAIERYMQQVQRTGLACRLEAAGEPPSLTSGVRLAIYRIVQEALHNVVRHADADEAVVVLEATDHLLRVTIRDNGAGFDPERAAGPTSLGLLSMRERAANIGATLEITARPGGGTAIVIERPASADVVTPETVVGRR